MSEQKKALLSYYCWVKTRARVSLVPAKGPRPPGQQAYVTPFPPVGQNVDSTEATKPSSACFHIDFNREAMQSTDTFELSPKAFASEEDAVKWFTEEAAAWKAGATNYVLAGFAYDMPVLPGEDA